MKVIPTTKFIEQAPNLTDSVACYTKMLSNSQQAVKEFTPTEKLLYEHFRNYMRNVDYFADKANFETAKDTAYRQLEIFAPHQFSKQQKEIMRERNPYKRQQKAEVLDILIRETIQKVVALYHINAHKAKETLNLFGAQKVRILSEKALKFATEREIYTQNANKILSDSGITDFALNDDYLALLVRSTDKNSKLTAKEQAILTDYRNFEHEAINRLNKLQRQSYNDQKRYALGMETLRSQTAKQREYALERYHHLIMTHNAEPEEKLLNLRDE